MICIIFSDEVIIRLLYVITNIVYCHQLVLLVLVSGNSHVGVFRDLYILNNSNILLMCK